MLLPKFHAARFCLLFNLILGLVGGLAGPVGCASAQSSTQSSAGAFLSTLEDVPLMPGLIEIAGAGMVFDKPDGRIAETFAEGALAVAAVRRFYEESLPQLGWRLRARRIAGAAPGDLVFERENERLSIGVAGKDGALRVRFALFPN
jgi:hypothetical protein